jgi:hypothetical protein
LGIQRTHVPFPLAPDEIWEAPPLLSVGGRDVPILSAENLALLLAGRGTKEGWTMLKRVSDFARMVDRHRHLDWASPHDRAKARGCGDALLLACAVTRELLDVAVPQALAPGIAISDRVHERERGGRNDTPGPAAAVRGRAFCRLSHVRPEDRLDQGSPETCLHADGRRLRGDEAPARVLGAYYATRPCRLAVRVATGRT